MTQQTLERLVVEIEAKTEQYRREMRRAEEVTGRFEQKTAAQLRGFEKRFGDTMQRTGQVAQRAGGPLARVGSVLAGLANPAAAAGAALGVLALGLTKATQVAGQFETLGLRTEAIIKATGSAAGFTAQQIAELSKQVARTTLADALGVEAAAQKLLTFRSVAGDVFTRTIELSQDLAAVGFGSIEGAAVQLGKALENPVEGLSALTRVGVSFSTSQKDLIRSLVESNQTLAAQELLLEAVAGQVSGAGRAEAGGLAGAFDTLTGNVQEFLQNIGNSGPIQAATSALRALAGVIENLNNRIFPSLQSRLSAAQDELARLESNPANRRNQGAQNLRVQAIRAEIQEVEALLAVREREEAQARERSAAVQTGLADERAAAAAAEDAEKRRVAAEKEAARSAKAAADAAAADATRRSEAIQQIEREIDVMRFRQAAQNSDAEARRRVEVLIEAENLALSNNIALGSAQYLQLLDLVEVRSRLTAEQERAARVAAAQSQFRDQQLSEQQRAAERSIQAVERRIDSVVEFGASAFAELFEGTNRGWSGLMDSMLGALRQTFARMAAEAVLRPIIAPVAAAFAGGASAAVAGSSSGVGIPPIGSVTGLFSGLSNLSLLGSGGATLGTNFAFSSLGRSLGLSQGIVGATGPALGLTSLGSAVGTGLNNLANPLSGIGGFVGNFGANLLLGDRGIGGNVGGTLGGLAGGAIFGPLGALGGAFLGNALGGLLGNNKPSDKSQGSTISASGITQFGMTGKKFDQETRNAVDGIASVLSGVLGTVQSVTGATLSGSIGFGVGSRDKSTIFRDGQVVARTAVGDPQAALRAALGVAADALSSDIPAELQRVLRNLDVSDAERALSDVAFAAALTTGKDLFPEPVEITAIEQAMDSLDAAMEAARSTAARLGLAFGDVEQQGAAAADRIRKAFSDDIQSQILRITDASLAQLEAIEKVAEERVRIAKRLGTDLTQVERLNSLERLAVVEAVSAEQQQATNAALSVVRSGLAQFELDTVEADRARRAAARSTLTTALIGARAGILPDSDKLAEALSALAPTTRDAATREDFLREAQRTRAEALELESILSGQVVSGDALLEEARRQTDLAELSYQAALDILSALRFNGSAIPGFAEGGNFLGGLRVVGEKGPELELTGPSRIFSSNQLGKMLGGTSPDVSALVEEVRALKQEVEAGNRSIAKHTYDTARRLARWDGSGMPSVREEV